MWYNKYRKFKPISLLLVVILMDANAIIAAIGSLGFPIVACAGLFWYITNQDKQHKEEMNKMSEALNNNTQAITKLAERMGANERN